MRHRTAPHVAPSPKRFADGTYGARRLSRPIWSAAFLVAVPLGGDPRTPRSAWFNVLCVTLNFVRRGSGSPLLLVHGLGAGWRSWSPLIEQLAERREVIAVDLPGFGETPPLTGEVSIATLTDSVADFIHEQGLDGVATVGQSLGGRIVLELARRGVGGDTVALDPGGFWSDRELLVFGATLRP